MNGKHTAFFNAALARSHRARSHKVWMIRLGAQIIASVMLASCSTLPTEQRLMGTWRMPADQFEDQFGVLHRVPTTAENTLRPDHTYTSRHLGHDGVIRGHWRLSGRWLSYAFPTRAGGRRVLERDRAKIVKLTERQLVVVDERGRSGEWTKVR